MVGTIKKFNLEKGWGFVQTATEDYFFHVTSFMRIGALGLDRKPRIGEWVTFEVGTASLPGKKTEAFKLRPFTDRVGFSTGLAVLAKGLEGLGGSDERA